MSEQIFYLVRLDSMRKTEKGADGRIAAFLLSRPDALPSLTIQKIADETGTGYITVCRFFKKLGMSGFKEFKTVLLREIENENENKSKRNLSIPDFSIENENPASFAELGKKICEYSAGVVANCHRIIRGEQLEKAASIISHAKHVHFIGLGTSAVAAQYAYTKFFRLKPACTFDSDVILSKMRAAELGENAVLFAISSSGRTKAILNIAELAHESGTTVISICDYFGSPLANLSDVCLCTTVRESNKYIDTDFPLIHGQITIIDILYAYLYHKTPDSSSLSIRKTSSVIENDKVKQKLN